MNSEQFKEKPYSSHIFVLPFYINNGKRFREEKIDEKEWETEPLSNGQAVKSQSYFKNNYPMVEDDPQKSKEYIQYAFERYFNAEALEILKEYTKTYIKKNAQGKFYQIKCYKNDAGTEVDCYELEINFINLRLISTGGNLKEPDIGFLLISADNYKYDNKQEINRINQFGRRVYAPFFNKECTLMEHADDIVISENSLSTKTLLSENVGKTEFRIMTAIDELLRSFFGFKNGEPILENIDKSKDELSLQRILDDRMFVLSNYRFSEEEYNKLADGFKGSAYQEFHFKNGTWNIHQLYDFQKELYMYIYVDNGYSCCQSPISVKEQLRNSVYDRWMDYGTLYGVSQHSMLMFTRPDPPNYLIAYFYTEYLEMLLLVLTQRVGILSFSMEAGKLAKDARDTASNIGEDTLKLQERYVVFKNQFLLPELSSQEQTIEMYNLIQKNFYIYRQKEMLDDQIQSLYEINQTKINNKRERLNFKMNLLLFIFTVWTFVTSYNDFVSSHGNVENSSGFLERLNWSPIVVYVIFAVVLILVFIFNNKLANGYKQLKNQLERRKK